MRPKVRGILGAYLFSNDDVHKKIKILSGGEKARVSLAKLMLQPYNLLILDEPTNHLDMVSKDILKQAVLNFKGSVVIVSHDREFLSGLTKKVYEFRDKKIHEYLGDINYFLEKRAIDHLDELSENNGQPTSNSPKEKKGNPNYREKREWEKALRKAKNGINKSEKKISELQEAIRKLDETVNSPEFYQQSDNPQLTFDEYNRLKKELEAAEEEWTALQIEKEELESRLQ